MTVLYDAALAEIAPEILYRILQLRSKVFVVEQECVFLDPDGRDLEPSCRQLWISEGDAIVATARVIDEGDYRRIGRIATDEAARGQGLAARLVEHFLATDRGPWLLDAQSHLAGWYGRFGFVVDGAEYLDDGIPHVPMRRPLQAGKP